MKSFKFFVLLLGFVFLTQPLANACSATVSSCSVTCTINAPTGGTASCYTEQATQTAHCYAYDANLNLVDSDVKSCSSGGGPGGGGSGTGWQNPDCQIYWWLCDPSY